MQRWKTQVQLCLRRYTFLLVTSFLALLYSHLIIVRQWTCPRIHKITINNFANFCSIRRVGGVRLGERNPPIYLWGGGLHPSEADFTHPIALMLVSVVNL